MGGKYSFCARLLPREPPTAGIDRAAAGRAATRAVSWSLVGSGFWLSEQVKTKLREHRSMVRIPPIFPRGSFIFHPGFSPYSRARRTLPPFPYPWHDMDNYWRSLASFLRVCITWQNTHEKQSFDQKMENGKPLDQGMSLAEGWALTRCFPRVKLPFPACPNKRGNRFIHNYIHKWHPNKQKSSTPSFLLVYFHWNSS